VLASLGVSLGLMMSTKVMRKRITDKRATHEILALSTIAAIVIHAGSLLGDQWLHPSLAALTIPFLGSYKSVWTSIGIIAGWSTIVLGLSYYARGRIGAVRWRKLHRFTALAWLAGLLHAVGEGTDAGQIWFLAMIAVVVVPALGLLTARLSGLGSRSPARRPAARAATPA
jgi:sulfoxide reductase heme-binding subunit YedZ